MPFVLDLQSHDILEIFDSLPGVPGQWTSVSLYVKRLVSMSQHDIEWEYFPVSGLIDQENSLLIVQDFEDVHDIEYYIRGGHLQWTYCNPVSIRF